MVMMDPQPGNASPGRMIVPSNGQALMIGRRVVDQIRN